VGAANALRVYAAWGGVLGDRPMRVLVYMALIARDKDAEPWFSQGHEVLAEMALALPAPGSPQAARVVRRAITQLHARGAIRTVKRATYGKRGTSNVHYRLYLDGPQPQVTNRPVDNSQPQVTDRPMADEAIGHSVVAHRSLSGRPQVTQRPTKEEEEEEELKDPEANLRNGEMWKAPPPHPNGSAEPAETATPRTPHARRR